MLRSLVSWMLKALMDDVFLCFPSAGTVRIVPEVIESDVHMSGLNDEM